MVHPTPQPRQVRLVYETVLRPSGSSIRSWATLLAMCPPFSNETAPITAYMVCASTSSRPEALRSSGYKKWKLAGHSQKCDI